MKIAVNRLEGKLLIFLKGLITFSFEILLKIFLTNTKYFLNLEDDTFLQFLEILSVVSILLRLLFLISLKVLRVEFKQDNSTITYKSMCINVLHVINQNIIYHKNRLINCNKFD